MDKMSISREAVLTSTHNLCFGAKIRKISIPLQTPVFLNLNSLLVTRQMTLFHHFFYIKSGGIRWYTFHGHVFFLMNNQCK